MKYTIDNGLIVDPSTSPPTCCGYIMRFEEHGAFAPNGKVEFTDAQIAEHNRLLAQAELEGLKKLGRGILYLQRVPKLPAIPLRDPHERTHVLGPDHLGEE